MPLIARQHRKCRLCQHEVESPEHVLLECLGNARITQLRQGYVTDLKEQTMATTLVELGSKNVVGQLKLLVHRPDTVKLTARFAYETTFIVDENPAYIHDLGLMGADI